eukprot:scaffold1913_cov151-Skeletonema_dohrnii-CCMP3373.AAC.3
MSFLPKASSVSDGGRLLCAKVPTYSRDTIHSALRLSSQNRSRPSNAKVLYQASVAVASYNVR